MADHLGRNGQVQPTEIVDIFGEPARVDKSFDGVVQRLAVDAVISGPGIPAVPNRAAVTFQTKTVTTAGTPENGPNITIPNGFSVAVRFRVTQAGNPRGFISNSAANAVLAASRAELLKGDVMRFFITNTTLLWFDSNTNGAVFELVVEQ